MQQSAAWADTPFLGTDVSKALFEARIQSLEDAELKFPWGSGVMGVVFLNLAMFQVCRHWLQNNWALQIRCTQLHLKMLLYLPHIGFQAGPSMCLLINAINVKPDKDLFAAQEVLLTKAIYKWIQVFAVPGFTGQLGEAWAASCMLLKLQSRAWSVRDALGVK